ncbi:GerAB/ArcD/ProY family transporter [Evansella clarkii]|uniref:GerAB/ArcD/ProY family transporter n=1 Tax=Evansella clarkii TaxID=79879 RepID=UPI0009977B9B|nr:GerAB/ArcD/ProY family transporter [Evansella clarkii]
MDPISQETNNGKGELITFTYSSTITLGLIFLPYISETEIRSAWLKVVLAVFPYFLLMYLINKVIKKHGEQDILGLFKQKSYKIFYYPVVLYLLFGTFYASLTGTKSLSIIVQTYLLQDTDQAVIIVAFLLVAFLGLLYGIRTITRMLVLSFLLEVAIVFSLSFIILSEDFRWINLAPVFSTDILTFGRSILSDMSRYGGVVTLLAFLPYVNKSVNIFKATSLGLLLVMYSYFVVCFTALGIFGFEQAMNFLSPATALIQATSARTGILERMDLFFLSIWIMSFYKIALIHFWFGTFLMNRIIKVKPKREWIHVCIFVALIAAISLSTPSLINFSWEPFNLNTLFYSLVVPMILVSYLLIRSKKGAGTGGDM